MNDQWLIGYTNASRYIQLKIKRLGWAKAKGWIKDHLRWAQDMNMSDPFNAGWIDAMLDSVN